MELDIHPASEAERLAAYRNVHDVWSRGLPMEEHLAWRLQSVQHNRARWFVGCVQGEVAVSLGCYAIEFSLITPSVDGAAQRRIVPGIQIGSVHTPAAYRGHGFAPRLIAWVEDFFRHRERAALSLLYSDIKPDYYARQGYRLCPSHEGWADPLEALRRTGLSDAVSPLGLVACDVEREAAEVSDLYRRFHGSLPLSIHRGEDYAAYLRRKSPRDECFFLVDFSDTRLGYVRITPRQATWNIVDYAVDCPSTDARAANLLDELYGSVLRLAAQRGVNRVGGWLPDIGPARRLFTIAPRAKEITMIKELGAEPGDSGRGTGPQASRPNPTATGLLTPQHLAAADWFCELDHV